MNKEEVLDKILGSHKHRMVDYPIMDADKEAIFDCMEEYANQSRELFNDSDLKHIQTVIELSFTSKNYHKTNPYFIHSKNIINKIKEILEKTIKFPLKR